MDPLSGPQTLGKSIFSHMAQFSYQIWLHSVSQGEGEPHRVQGGEYRGQPGLLDLSASGNAVNIVFGKRSTGVSISSIYFKRIYFTGTHFISVSNDIMSRRVSVGQVLEQSQDLNGMPTGPSHHQEAERPPGHSGAGTQHYP